MQHSSSSGAELLLRSRHRLTPLRSLRRSKVTMMVAAGLLVLVVLSVVLGVALRPRREAEINVGLQHAALARLAMANISFNSSSPASPAIAALVAHLSNQTLRFTDERKDNGTDFKMDGYDELDRI